MGGDEFIFIMEDTTEDKVEYMLKSWQKILDASNAARTDFKCEMASGYAIGAGKDIEEVVKIADDRMYKNKIAMKGFAR
jgi:GGDEF domain-containing protein